MSVEVRVTSVLQRLVGAKSIKGDGSTVGELLANLDATYPGFMSQITGDGGELHRFVNIYLNDEDIRYLGALDTPLKDGDVLSILPALAGGSRTDEGVGRRPALRPCPPRAGALSYGRVAWGQSAPFPAGGSS